MLLSVQLVLSHQHTLGCCILGLAAPRLLLHVLGLVCMPPSSCSLTEWLNCFQSLSLLCILLGQVLITETRAGMLAGGLLGISDGFGALTLSNNLALPGLNEKAISIAGSQGLLSEQMTRNSLNSSNSTVPSLPFAPGMAQPNGLPFGWMSMADPEGRMFYFNNLTGAAQWNPPLSA